MRDIVLKSLHTTEETPAEAEELPPDPTDPRYREWCAERRRANTMLLEAAATSHIAALRKAVADGADLGSTDDQGRTGLWLCSARGCTEGVQVLLEAKVDPEQRCRDGELPLVAAAMADHPEV